MKIQYIIFILVVIGLVYIVYPSDRSGIEEARERMEQSQNISEDLLSETQETNNDILNQNEALDGSGDDPVDTSIQEQIERDDSLSPAPSLDVRDIMDINTPSFVDFGDPVAVSDMSFVYNQVRGLEIFRDQIEEELTCDDLTDFLTERLRSWFFWNTCRFIDGERGLKFNVLRLQGEEFVYERHYIDRVASLYGILELERGTGIESDMLPEKNVEFREREFPLIEVGDSLMRELIQVN